MRQKNKEWHRLNPHKQAEYAWYRIRQVKQAKPRWANDEEIKKIYQQAKQLTETIGTTHHVDHVIPIQGKNVCGLHVETNLEVILASENYRKSNRFDS
ncbi:hypothetical protein LCGC14_1670790, partial [marine sediment metagenome]